MDSQEFHDALYRERCRREAVESENRRLRAAILQTLDDNGHLADGENCTLIALKLAIEASSVEFSGSALDDWLANSLPWHIGFHNEIADRLMASGDWHPDMVRYKVVQVCAHDGRHVCWAKSPEHAALIVKAVNAEVTRPAAIGRSGEPKASEG